MNSNGKEQQIESPCIRNCCLDEQDICLGCFRTLAEIIQWTLVSDQDRRVFLKNTVSRRAQHKSKK